MDKATDLCETKGFLQKSVLEELNNYLDDKDNDIIINFPKYYIDNINQDLFIWYTLIDMMIVSWVLATSMTPGFYETKCNM